MPRGDRTEHLIGLLLGTEEDWPRAFEELVRRLGAVRHPDGTPHTLRTERITIEPFDLRDRPRYDLVIDRLAYWYYHPREWLKKVALMDDVYLLNSPFTFQSMEKHAAYCAMIRLGLKVPDTWLVPPKDPLDNARWAYTSSKYNRAFDLDGIAERVGYPMFMKPFDGGAWVGVSRITDAAALHKAYDESGQRLMHLQASVEGYDSFARSLTIGAETMVMKFRPELPMHDRYEVALRLPAAVGRARGAGDLEADQRVLPVGVQLLRVARGRRRGPPDRLRQRLPGHRDHLAALLLPVGDQRAAASGRRSARSPGGGRGWTPTPGTTSTWPTPTGRTGTSWPSTRGWPTRTSRRTGTEEFCATSLASLDEIVRDWVASPEFDALLVDTVQVDLPGPRAGPLRRPLPRPAAPLGARDNAK